MASFLAKGGIAFVGVGGIGLGGLAASSYSNPEKSSIKTLLKSKGYKLTSELPINEQTEAWKKVSKTYALEVNDNLRIKDGNLSEEDIKNWCIYTIEQQDKDFMLKKAEKWCTIYSTFEDKLKEEKLSMETDVNTFKTKYSSLGNLKAEVDKITAENSGSGGDDNGQKLKKWCHSNAYLSREDRISYQDFKKHCKK
ncbi:hypothetical protein MHC_02310 [Mycoplasma haemocanis str. Illinois]|uniref:Uncharacterized protein n=1 Tax=Mycoplasma haemocanis (strain Illinois) TaxID=1111676 RepID=H6N6Q6_MYCHN|nr:hypothetical protein [Mycoplasma haemocanis]AEW45328.1 hypothetical protein MHC_02310 [Mycoplasma haemocanis str. Illinois]